MRINPEVETKWRDAFGEIHIPETSHCPNQIKKICENILTMYTGLDGVCPTSYNTMSELDKMIMVNYIRLLPSEVSRVSRRLSICPTNKQFY